MLRRTALALAVGLSLGGAAQAATQQALSTSWTKVALSGSCVTVFTPDATGQVQITTSVNAPASNDVGRLLNVWAPLTGFLSSDLYARGPAGSSIAVDPGFCPSQPIKLSAANGDAVSTSDPKYLGALQKSQALAELSDVGSLARAHLGLGTAATLNIGTGSGGVMASDDARVLGALQVANAFGEIATGGYAAAARTNLGLGGAAVLNVGTANGTVLSGSYAAQIATAQATADGKTTAAQAAAAAPVQSVAGRTGSVALGVTDVAGAAPLASPALTGTPSAPTAATGANTTQLATTAFATGGVSAEATRAQTAEQANASNIATNTSAISSEASTARAAEGAALSAAQGAQSTADSKTTAAQAAAAAPVQSVAGRTGSVTLAPADIPGVLATTGDGSSLTYSNPALARAAMGSAKSGANTDITSLANVSSLTLGGSTVSGVGTTAGTVAAGNDGRITGALQAVGNDGSAQVRTATTQGAVETWQLMGGISGAGPSLRVSPAVFGALSNGSIFASGGGTLYLGNDYGVGLEVLGGTNATNIAHFQALALPGGFGGALVATSSSGDTNRPVSLIPAGSGYFSSHIPVAAGGTSGSIAGTTAGNTPGPFSVDLQMYRTQAYNIAGSTYSVLVGGANNTIGGTASGASAVGGYDLNAYGQYTRMMGVHANDNGRYAYDGQASGYFSSAGDAQAGRQVLYGSTTGGTAVRLTAGALTPQSGSPFGDCINLIPYQKMALDITIVASDITTQGHAAAYFNKALLYEGATASTATLAAGTPTALGSDTLTVTTAADTTNGCLNLSVTPPGSDQWHIVATVLSTEAK